MKRTTIHPNKYVVVSFTAPPIRFVVRIKIHSTIRVHSYVLDDDGLDAFKSGEPKMSVYGGLNNRMHHDMKLRIPAGSVFHVVVFNPKDDPATAEIDVTSEPDSWFDWWG